MKNKKPFAELKDRRNFLNLNLNESYYFLDENILKDLKNFDNFTLSSYPDYQKITGLIADYSNFETEEVIVTNGAEQAIQLVIQALFEKNDEVLLPAPTFPVYYHSPALIGAKPKIVLYKEDKGNFVFPFSEISTSISKNTKGILLCNPNNPLGCSISEEEITAILKKTKKLKIPVVIDEAYYEFYGRTSAKLLKSYSNLIIIRSLSKAFGIAGLRLGYVIADKKVITKISKIRLPRAVNHFAVYAGEIVLKHRGFFEEKIRESLKIKSELIKFFKEKGIKCYDTKANFIVLRLENHKKIIEDLELARISVSDISKSLHGQRLLKNTIRISVPSKKDSETLKNFFNRYY